MIAKFFATTALATVIATSAFAQSTIPSDQSATPAATDADAVAKLSPVSGTYLQNAGVGQYLASDLTGANLYQGPAADAAEAGEIQNFLIDAKGKVLAVIVNTGNFLDNAKTVAVPADKINWVVDADNEPRPVLTASREELTAAPAFTQMTAAEAAQGAAPALTDMAAGTAMAPAPAAPIAAPSASSAAASMGSADKAGYIAALSGDQQLSQTLIGSKVYSGPGSDAETVGSVNDLVLTKSGNVAGVVIGVGGFLGIGEKNVGIPFENLSVAQGEGNEPRMILAATKDQLTAAPIFDTTAGIARTTASNSMSSMATTGAATGAAAGAAVGSALDTTQTAANNAATSAGNAVDTAAGKVNATAQSTTDAMSGNAATGTAADATTTASTGGANDRASMTPVTGAELSAETLTGTTVYGPNDENIGSVSDIALTADGKVDAIILDVGGFLGIGQKSVAVAMDNLQFMKDSGGSVYLYTAFTQDQLKNAPEYNKAGYAENRDTMRIKPDAVLPAATSGGTSPAPAPAQ